MDNYLAFRKFADPVDHGQHNEGNVPYEHMAEHNGKAVRYGGLKTNGNVIFFGKGKMRVTEQFIDILGESCRVTVPRSSCEPIAWHEDSKSYTFGELLEVELL